MKTKVALALFLCISLLLCACAKKPKDKNDDSIPENGVHYEYSSGGNSDRVISKTIYENSVAVKVDKYDYWDTGELKTVTTTVGDTVTDIWDYLYAEGGSLKQMVHSFNEGDSKCRDDYRYNQNGTLAQISYYTDDVFSGGIRYTYNKGNTKPCLEENLDPNGDTVTYTEYLFTESGEIAKASYYMYGSVINYRVYQYNDSEKLSQISFYSSDDVLQSKSEYVYSADGRISQIKELDPNGNLLGYTECLYDDEGFNYRDIYYEDGKPVYRYDYTENGIPTYSEY